MIEGMYIDIISAVVTLSTQFVAVTFQRTLDHNTADVPVSSCNFRTSQVLAIVERRDLLNIIFHLHILLRHKTSSLFVLCKNMKISLLFAHFHST